MCRSRVVAWHGSHCPPATARAGDRSATALAYAVVGWLSPCCWRVPPAYASPLYPSAGIALAATLVYGRASRLPGVLLGAFARQRRRSALRAGSWPALACCCRWSSAPAPALQAALGATLMRRFVAQPLVLNAPRDILLAGLLGGLAGLHA